jgi:hypothetical protein
MPSAPSPSAGGPPQRTHRPAGFVYRRGRGGGAAAAERGGGRAGVGGARGRGRDARGALAALPRGARGRDRRCGHPVRPRPPPHLHVPPYLDIWPKRQRTGRMPRTPLLPWPCTNARALGGAARRRRRRASRSCTSPRATAASIISSSGPRPSVLHFFLRTQPAPRCPYCWRSAALQGGGGGSTTPAPAPAPCAPAASRRLG